MRPTRRGLAVLAIASAAVVLAGAHGPRALNAIAAPLFGAVAFGAVQVWRVDDPEVDCHAIEPGFPGAERRYTVELTGSGVFDVTHAWPSGLDGDRIDAVVAGSDTVETDVTLAARGRYDVGPPAIYSRDALGLVRTRVETEGSTRIVVYPEIHNGVPTGVIGGLLGADVVAERQEFDRLREYVPGDPLRDVHWKASAKGEDFFVAEYEPSDRTEAITILATAEPDAVDEMATAAGTIAVLALEAGLSVGLRLPDRSIPPGSGRDHESTILAALAAATEGSVEGSDAHVSIHATPAETQVTVGDTTHRFADLVEAPAATTPMEVAEA